MASDPLVTNSPERWTWPFTSDQVARLAHTPASTDGEQDVFFYGPEAPTCLGMFGPTWADGFGDSEPGDVWFLSFHRMTLDEINNLPEFTGF